MRVSVNGVRLFFDVEGTKFVPDGPMMREKPVLLMRPVLIESEQGPNFLFDAFS